MAKLSVKEHANLMARTVLKKPDDNAGYVFKDKIYSTKVMIPETTRALSAYVNYILARSLPETESARWPKENTRSKQAALR